MGETFFSKIEKNNGNSTWSESYLNDIPEFTGEKKFTKLEKIADLCDLKNSMLSGHGAGSVGNNHEVIENIFEEGLKGFESIGNMVGTDRAEKVVGSTDLTDNTIGLWSSSEGDPDFAKLEETLSEWPHRGSENIILMRFPLEYYHAYTEIGDERTQAYFTMHEDQNGQPTNYVDRRFIVGNYNTKTGQVELNPHFVPEISGDFKTEFDERLEKVKEQTKKRHKKINEMGPFGHRSSEDVPEEKDSTSGTYDWDDKNWV